MLSRKDVAHHQGLPASEFEFLRHNARGDDGRLKRMIVRRGFGEPLAYIVGEVEQGGVPFFIDRRCYIPDADTTLLVHELTKDLEGFDGSVLELGTGCGWIAVSVKLSLPKALVIGCDIDPSVLGLARANSRRHNAHVQFCESSYADDLPIIEPDFIIADLPYGGDASYSEEELKERPHLPPVSVFHPISAMHCYVEAIKSVQRRGWRSNIYMETGYLPESRVRDALGEDGVEYRQIKDGFSVTIVDAEKANPIGGAP
jgi:release factor glutamine methyltransferase